MTEGAILTAPGTPCWVSLAVQGLNETEDFYATLFGWSFEEGPPQLGPYVLARLRGREVAGIGTQPPGRRLPVAWTPYLATEDADAAAEQIRFCGGTVGVGPLNAGAAGRMAICSDPAGAVFGIWQPEVHTGTERTGRPGTPVWNELLLRDPSLVSKFYELVFGYDVRRSGEDVTLLVRGEAVAAIRAVDAATMRARGPRWVTYFESADVDDDAARVAGLGGQVLREPHDTDEGRVAEVADPAGATFTLVRSARR